ncbi:MAG: hypothetical protein H6536_05145 [Bacteroidales bacterium]|nr:hypothetical protein [Bacteroidales bacterium]
MKPFKSALPFATWLIRIFFAAYIFIGNIKGVNPINFESLNFYLSLALLILSVLLVVGGFTSGQSITVVSAILIGLILLYRFVIPTPDLISESTFRQMLLISVSFFFVCRGN